MKNPSESRFSNEQSYLTNTHFYQAKPQDYQLELDNNDSASALSQGLYHQVEDWIALELTAEQMLGDEVNKVSTYVANDAKQMWSAIKDSLLPYELAAGQFLLKAADPTQVEWLQNHWWNAEEAKH